jgi:DNA segregation ATPase FtsK/SpoIIIE-like protein
LGGGKSETKPAQPKSQSGQKSGGLFSGLTGRFGGGKKDDPKKTASPYGSSSSSTSPYGGSTRPGTSPTSSPTGTRPGSSTADSGKSSTFGAPLGKLGSSSSSTSTRPAGSASGQRSGLGRFFPFFGGGSKPTEKKPRTSKAPQIDQGGLTLDNKLDILGVALVLGGLVLIFSRLSTTKGALTEWANDLLITTFGWGALAIPVAMLAVGIWLIARHFGEEAPVIPRMRVFGLAIFFTGMLLVMQFIDSFGYVNPDGSPVTLEVLRNVWLPLAIERGTGGGWLGAELYYTLVSNLTEAGAFFAIVGWIIVGVMFTLGISAAELAMIAISWVRGLGDARQRRAQRRAQAQAIPLEQLTAQAQPPITVQKPADAALPSTPSVPALPAAPEAALPAPEPARAISINIGGKKDTAVPAKSPLQPSEKPSASPAPSAQTAAPGGFASRLRSALPGGKPVAASEARPDAPKPAEPKKDEPAKPGVAGTAAAAVAGGVRGLFSRSPAEPKPDDKSAEKPGEKPSEKPPMSPVPAKAAASPVPGAGKPGPFTPADEPARLGDLMRPEASSPKAETRAAPTSPPASPVPAMRSPVPAPPAADKDKLPASPAIPGTARPDAPKPFGAPSAPAASPFSPAKPASPFAAKPSAKPEDAFIDDDIDEDGDELDTDDEELKNLPPAQPTGRGPLPRPAESQSRFGPTTFGAKPAEERPAPTGTGRQDRLNAIRSGGAVGAPSSPGIRHDGDKSSGDAKPEQPAAEKAAPAAAASAAPPVPAAPARPSGAVSPPVTSSSGDKVTSAPKSPLPSIPDKPAEKVAEMPGKLEQPAAVKPPFEPTSRPASAQTATPTVSPAPGPGVSPSFGRPSSPPAMPNIITNVASSTPPPPSPEIALRQPGVGTIAPTNVPRRRKEWRQPSLSQVLMPGSEGDIDRETLLRRARIIEDTLSSFGAPGKVVEVNTGPVITQFGVEPDYLTTRGGKKNRVKVSAIAQLDKDIQLALGAKSIRIEAPVPGKGYVGIEVPNDHASLVSLRDVMESDAFKRIANKSPLTIALGQSVDGTPVAADLGSMPHLLIAGTTGSGKSVCVNSIIASLIILNPPDRVKFIMVDPKRVELTGYNGIPHLVAPVVVELERIVGVLKWVTREMDERYKRFSIAGARNIEDFNKHLPEDAERMPYIVVIIDELADLMMLAPDETERVITRIAALARATGIHLVIATQRPSVDVVTGLIKANFPARIAFAVAGGVDSRVILDQPGAERLLGRGDMLYMSGDSPAPVRLQGVFVSDTEINNIVRHWKAQANAEDTAVRPISALVVDNTVVEAPRSVVPGSEKSQLQAAFWDKDERPQSTVTSVSAEDGDENSDSDDVLYEEAVEMVRRLNKASVSLLQRRLRIGYTRAARLIDRMEEEGIVGPATEGSKPREVLPSKD